ncbi:hypothetical protein [Nocardioides jiangsuensis]|jgi:hypothetical protein|uniref:hypothetical protein n=1 Tax=Nocardioides jiangsuensis TaxID=2866161 RepID=UPI001CEC2224|nr:hypothetical protein [Nocardioides jiangsuensis]
MTNSLEPSGFPGESASGSSSRWWWRLEDASGNEVRASDAAQEFPSQSDAESWVGEAWRELLDDGVDAVTLFEGDREVYGPMSLHANT